MSTKTKTNSRLRHLRVKIKSLAAEAKIIRHEERQTLARPGICIGTYNVDYEDLRVHRRGVVGVEARHSLLAYACLRGLSYKAVEPRVRIDYVWSDTSIDGNVPDWNKIKEIASRFGGNAEAIDSWIDDAQSYITSYARKEAA
jgi:hypothetical protein